MVGQFVCRALFVRRCVAEPHDGALNASPGRHMRVACLCGLRRFCFPNVKPDGTPSNIQNPTNGHAFREAHYATAPLAIRQYFREVNYTTAPLFRTLP